jgi:two-component system cell cycle response regulator
MSDEKTVVAEQNPETTSALPSRSSPVLLQYDGGAAGKKFILTTKVVTLGRRPEKTQVWIDDPSVSREHCQIEFDGNRATVTDLGSLNHTFVNDKMVMQSSDLCHGDMLRVGNVRLRYFAHGSADQLLFDRIYRMAVQDRMLEIFRRDYLLEKLEEEFKLAKMNGTELSLAFFDLDKFKGINDTYGHDAGDLVLKEVCKTLKPFMRTSFVFGRYGGEEFCVVMPQLDVQAAVEFSEKMRLTIEAMSVDYEGTLIPVTISIGVASVTSEMGTPQDLIRVADGLVYESKNAGRNRVSAPK